MRVPVEILNQIAGYEAVATPGPWTANGNELYFGQAHAGVTHQEIPCAKDARLIAVMRSWLPDLLADLREAVQ